MGAVTEADVAAVIGRIDEIIIQEIVRTGASRPELRRAFALAKGPADFSMHTALPPRMRRLVDLLAVALPQQGPPHSRASAVKGVGRAA